MPPNRIIRVFPLRTSYTPTDEYVFTSLPPMEIPPHDEVHISCVFSWDKPIAEELAFQWQGRTDKPVKLGGVAYDSPAESFVQGLYCKSNIVFTTRGCNNSCPWCVVPKIEGKLRELPVVEGNIIQDNNFLQSDRKHKDIVFEMLKKQKGICFKGGLQNSLIDDHFVEAVRGLKIKELWLACDTDDAIPKFKQAAEKLTKAGFSQSKLNCYALIKGEDMAADEARLREIYNAGCMPFAQLYQPPGCLEKVKYSADWCRFQRMWSRPAATIAHMEKGTEFWEFVKINSPQFAAKCFVA